MCTQVEQCEDMTYSQIILQIIYNRLSRYGLECIRTLCGVSSALHFMLDILLYFCTKSSLLLHFVRHSALYEMHLFNLYYFFW